MEAITQDQFRANLKKIESDYNTKKSKAYSDYARSNDPIQNDDIITDGNVSIKVHGRRVFTNHFNNSLPCMMYHGVRIKKDGTPFKSGEFDWIYQNNIEAINGVSTKIEDQIKRL